LVRELREFSTRHAMFAPGDRVAVAVSGGADSVALLLLLVEVAGELGLQLSVAHFDHRWRPESGADAAWVGELAAKLGLPFYLERGEPARSGNLEQQSRLLRYAFFKRLQGQGVADKAATAHTRDDQAETVLLRVLRGAGTRGLAGILPIRDGFIVRPLLRVARVELRPLLDQRGQSWRQDATNLDLRFRRNLLRAQVMPRLRAEFNPALEERLAALAEVQRAEEVFWSDYLGPLLEAASESMPLGLRLRCEPLRRLPLAVRRRLVRLAMARVQGHWGGLEYALVEQISAWIEAAGNQPRIKQIRSLSCRVSSRYLELRVQDRGPHPVPIKRMDAL